jgi:hypothetical protein
VSIDITQVQTTITVEPDTSTSVEPDGDAISLVEADGEQAVLAVTVPLTTLLRDPEPAPTIVTTDLGTSIVSVGTPGPPGPQGPQGPQGPSGVPADVLSYVHDQQVPLDTWTIDHDLGYVPGGVTVIDTLGEVVWGEVAHPSVNRTILTFSAAFSGVAYLS